MALLTNDARGVVKFLKKKKVSRFETPRKIFSDGDTHFVSKQFDHLLAKYRVIHKVATPHHQETSG